MPVATHKLAPPSNEYWTPEHIVEPAAASKFPDRVHEKLSTAKSVILVLQYGAVFSTDHELLDEFDDCAKIVVVNRNVINLKTDKIPKCLTWYDLVVSYEGPVIDAALTGNDAYITDPGNEICIPEVYHTACYLIETHILDKIHHSKSMFHIASLEEELVMQVAFLNAKYNLSAGMQPDFARFFVSKMDMIKRAERIGAAPKTLGFKIDPTLSARQMAEKLLLKDLEDENIPSFPLFGKPIAGADSDDTRKLANMDDLVAWIDEVATEGELGFDNFLVQEFLDGDFFITQTFVTSDGQLEFIWAGTAINSWTRLISEGVPAATVFLTPDEPVWRELRDFSFRFLDEFNARRHPGSYMIEVIRIRDNKRMRDGTGAGPGSGDSFKLLETYCRPDNGPSENKIIQMVTGLDMESMHLMAPFIDSHLVAKMSRRTVKKYKSGASIWYPNKTGVVLENRPIDVPLPAGSKLAMTKFYNAPGDLTRSPYVSSELRCEAFLLAQSFQDAYETARRCIDFDPVIVVEPGDEICSESDH